MIRTVLALLTLTVALLLPKVMHAQTQPEVTWTQTVLHLDWKTATRVVARDTHTYAIRHPEGAVSGYWTHTTQRSPHVRVITRFPIWKTAAPAPTPTPAPSTSGSYQQSMLITFYDDYGYMADGDYVHSGAAACGYDLGETENGASHNARVYVPGVGLLTCEDRIGFQPYDHIDVWMPSFAAGQAAGLGFDHRVVTVYP